MTTVHLTMSFHGRIKADAHSVMPGGGLVSLGKSSSDQRHAAPEMSTPARGEGSRDCEWCWLVRAEKGCDVMVTRMPRQKRQMPLPLPFCLLLPDGAALAESTLAEGFQRFG